jgi:hypothetical protein
MMPEEKTEKKAKPDPLKVATGGMVGLGQQLQAPGEAQKGNMLNNFGAKNDTEKARDELKAAGVDIPKAKSAPVDRVGGRADLALADTLRSVLGMAPGVKLPDGNPEAGPLPQSKDHLGDTNFTMPVGAGGQGKILDQSPPVEVAPQPGFMQAAKDLPIPTQTTLTNGNPAQVDAATPPPADKAPDFKDFGLGLLGILQAATAGRTAGLQNRALDYQKETYLGKEDQKKADQKQMDWQQQLQELTNVSRAAEAKADRDLQERLTTARTDAEVAAAKQQYQDDIGRIKEQGFQQRLTQREAVAPAVPSVFTPDTLGLRSIPVKK